jgi:hypothetical protein
MFGMKVGSKPKIKNSNFHITNGNDSEIFEDFVEVLNLIQLS